MELEPRGRFGSWGGLAKGLLQKGVSAFRSGGMLKGDRESMLQGGRNSVTPYGGRRGSRSSFIAQGGRRVLQSGVREAGAQAMDQFDQSQQSGSQGYWKRYRC